MMTQVEKNKRALLFPANSEKFALFLTGFPKYPGSNKFIDFLNNQNYNILCPLYSGTFDSDGLFSVDFCVNDIKFWYDFVTAGKFFLGTQMPQKAINPSEIIIFSHSFGSYILDLSLRKYDFGQIKKAIFLSPLSNPNKHQSEATSEIAKTTRDIVERSYPFSYRFENIEDFFNELSGKKPNPLSFEKIKQNNLEALILSGKDDKTTPGEMAKSLTKDYKFGRLEIIEGGHSSGIDLKQATDLIGEFLAN